MLDRKIEAIYAKLQSEFNLKQECITKAQKLHEILIAHDSLRAESPYLMAASCVLTISCMNKTPRTLGEISEILHVKEDRILEFEKFVADQMKIMLKNF